MLCIATMGMGRFGPEENFQHLKAQEPAATSRYGRLRALRGRQSHLED